MRRALSEDELLRMVKAAADEDFRMVCLTDAQRLLGVSKPVAFMAALVLEPDNTLAPPFSKEQAPAQNRGWK